MAHFNEKQMSEVGKASLALPIEITNLENLRKVLNLSDDSEPNEIFEELIGNKEICSRKMLKELFHLDNEHYHRCVIVEGRRIYDRRFYYDSYARQVVRLTVDHNCNPIPFSPAQVKLRALLAKRMDWWAYSSLMQDLSDMYEDVYYDDYCFDDNGSAIMEACSITEEELLDALRTYQTEHQS